MSRRGYRAHINPSSNSVGYRGIPIAPVQANTVHCKIRNQQTPIDEARKLHDPDKPACFACAGTNIVRYRCQS